MTEFQRTSVTDNVLGLRDRASDRVWYRCTRVWNRVCDRVWNRVEDRTQDRVWDRVYSRVRHEGDR